MNTELAAPRGIRNNNPLNIRQSSDQWDGMSPDQSDPEFVRFDTPEAGVRAAAKNLFTYRDKHGLDTIEGIVGRWAPPTENNTGSYVQSISGQLGVDPKSKLDFDDEDTMLRLVKAMTQHENGEVPWDDETFRKGIRAATGREGLPVIDQEAAKELSLAAAEEDRERNPIQWGDTEVIDPVDRDSLEAIQHEIEANSPGFLEGTKMAIGQEWGFLWALGAEKFAPDPQWRLDDQSLRDLTQDIPEDYWDLFEDAHSQDHALHIRKVLQDDLKAQEKLASMGWEGTALRLGAAILDPVALGISVASEGAAAPFVAGVKAGRIGKMLMTGTTAAAGNMVAELIPHHYKPTHSGLDILYAGAGGFALGGAIGGLARNKHTAAEAARLTMAGLDLTRAIELEALARAGSDAHLSHAGAAQASYREALRNDVYDWTRESDTATAPETAFGRVRWDAVGQAKSSDNVVTRALGGNMAEDAVGNADRSIATQYGATEWQHRTARAFEVEWMQTYGPAYSDWAKRNKLNAIQRRSSHGMFNDEVTRYVRNTDPTQSFDPAVVKAGEAYRSLTRRIAELANNPGSPEGRLMRPVAGFGDLVADPHYVTRVFDHRKIDDLRNRVGDTNLRHLIKGAIREAVPEMEEALAEKYARRYWDTVRGLGWGQETRVQNAFSGRDIDYLRELLKADGDMSDEEVEAIASLLQPKKDGAHARAKSRLDLSENFGMVLKHSDGVGESFVRVSDLLDNDIHNLFQLYNRQITGAAAMARLSVPNPKGDGTLLINGVTSKAEWEAALRQVRAVGAEIGQDQAALQKDIDNLEYLYRAVMGIPHHLDNRPAVQVLRMIGDYNFLRVMNQVGFAQIAEIGNITGQLGLKAALANMPSFRALWRNAKTGKLDDDLMSEMEGIWGIGADWLRGRNVERWDDFGSLGTYSGSSKFLNSADKLLHGGKRVTSAISGMSTVNTVLHRWSMRGIAQKFSDLASNPSKANMNRMRSLGLSDEMLTRVLAQMKTHRTTERGLWSDKVRRINLDRWTDQEAREAFKNAVDRWAKRIIQENDPGMMHRWFSSPIAKMLIQFRSFMLGSWSKQFLHGIHMRDFETFAAFTASSLWAGIAYTAQTYAQSVGRSDQEKFLQRRLSLESMAKASFQRAGYASILPNVADVGAMFVGLDPFFDYRGSGLPSNLLFGNPTVDLFDRLSKATQGVSDGRLTQRELRDINSVLPFSNFLPWQQLYNTMIFSNPK